MTDYERKAYKEAQRRIAEAKASGATALNLDILSLNDLPSEIVSLTTLRCLCASNTKITNLRSLANLAALESLDVSFTKITDLAPLAHLPAVTDLNISGTEITDISPLVELPNLKSLDIGNTRISDFSILPKFLCRSSLTSLDLTSAKFSDLALLSHFAALTALSLWSTEVSCLSPLKQHTALSRLALCFTKVTDLSPLSHLPALKALYLDDCTSLTHLGLPEAILARLTELTLNNCPITDIPREFCQRGWQENVAREVHAYVRGLREQGSAVLNECKLIVLGNGRAGKTSAIKALQGGPFDPNEKSTHAIRFWKWERELVFPPGGVVEQARVNVWDFGGQDIYHQAHRLFLRTRAVFLVCWNPWEQTAALRADGDEPRALPYWLEQIHALHSDPRILILRTHADCDATELAARGIAKVPDWRDTVPEKFRDLPSIALGAAAPDARTVAEIHRQLDAAFVAEMSAGSRAVPAGWAAARRRLSGLSDENEAAFRAGNRPPHAVLSEQEFAALVEASLAPDVTARDPAEARSFLHDIGAIFYDERLGGRVVLDQRWFIEGIYAVLRPGPFREWLEEGGGTFTARDLAPQWSRAGYAEGDEQAVLLSFMQACEQAAEIMQADETVNNEAVYLSPSLLPKYDEDTVDAWPQPPGTREFRTGYASLLIGADVAQAFIVAVAKKFLRGGRYWRWGAQLTSQKLGATARIEWNPHEPDSYGGEISITTWGERDAADQLYLAVRDCIQAFVPHGALLTSFTTGPFIGKQPIVIATFHKPKPDDAEEVRRAHPLEAAADDRRIAQGRYLSFSIAGESAKHPGIEGAPTALFEALKPAAERRGWEVFLYKQSTDQPDVGGLLRRVGKGDYVVAFLSKKYLESEYCMEELWLAYDAEPKGKFPPEKVRIFGFPGWRPADFREWMALSEQWKTTLKAKQGEWAARYQKLLPDFDKAKAIIEKEPAHGWFKLCLDEGEMEMFQRVLENYAATPAPLHFSAARETDREWLAKWIAEISGRLGGAL